MRIAFRVKNELVKNNSDYRLYKTNKITNKIKTIVWHSDFEYFIIDIIKNKLLTTIYLTPIKKSELELDKYTLYRRCASQNNIKLGTINANPFRTIDTHFQQQISYGLLLTCILN